MTDLQRLPQGDLPVPAESTEDCSLRGSGELGSAAGITDELLAMTLPTLPVDGGEPTEPVQSIEVSARSVPPHATEEPSDNPDSLQAPDTAGDEARESLPGEVPLESATSTPHPDCESTTATAENIADDLPPLQTSAPSIPLSSGMPEMASGPTDEQKSQPASSGRPLRRFVREHPRWTVVMLLAICAGLLPFIEAEVSPEPESVKVPSAEVATPVRSVITDVTPVSPTVKKGSAGPAFWPDDLNATPAAKAPEPFQQAPVMHAVTSHPAGTPSHVQPAAHSDRAASRPVIQGARLTGTIEFDEEPPTVSPMTNPEPRRTVSRFGE